MTDFAADHIRQGLYTARTLLACVALMMAPLLVSHLLDDADSLSVAIPLAFVLAMGCLIVLHLNSGSRVERKAILVATWLGITQILPLWWGALVGDPVFIGDLANILVKPVVFLVLIAFFFDVSMRQQELSIVLQGFTWIVSAACLYGFFSGVGQLSSVTLGTSSYSIDYSSFLSNRNQFGMLLFLGIAALLFMRALRGPRLLDLALGLMMIVSVILTMSRGSLLGVALLLGLVVAFKKPGAFALFLIPTLILGASLTALNPLVRNYILQFFIRPDAGLSGRDAVWSIALQMIGERPIQGWGIFRGLAEAETRGMLVGQFHSFWLEQLVDWGVLGFSTICALFIVIWTRAYRATPSHLRPILSGVGLGAIAMATFESISVLSVGYVDMLWTLAVLTLPTLLARIEWPSHEMAAGGPPQAPERGGSASDGAGSRFV